MTQNINNEGGVWTGCFILVSVCVEGEVGSGIVANLWLTWLKIPFHFAHKSAKLENISEEIRPIGNILIKILFLLYVNHAYFCFCLADIVVCNNLLILLATQARIFYTLML